MMRASKGTTGIAGGTIFQAEKTMYKGPEDNKEASVAGVS